MGELAGWLGLRTRGPDNHDAATGPCKACTAAGSSKAARQDHHWGSDALLPQDGLRAGDDAPARHADLLPALHRRQGSWCLRNKRLRPIIVVPRHASAVLGMVPSSEKLAKPLLPVRCKY